MVCSWQKACSLLSCITVLTLMPWQSIAAQSSAEVQMSGDDLNTIFGLPWAADDWPFGKTIQVQRNSIDPTVVGHLVLDRHGVDSAVLIKAPFAGPRPGRVVLISGWQSFDGGCVAELIIQVAVEPSQLDASVLIPTEIAMNVNGQVVTLPSLPDEVSYSDATAFEYSETVWDDAADEYVTLNKPGVWYTARHLFRISEANAAILRQAPAEDTTLRVVLNNRQPFTYTIGESTTERWDDVFSFNPSCDRLTSSN